MSQEGVFALDYYTGVFGSTFTDFSLSLIVQEDQTNNGRAVVQTTNSGSVTSLTATIVYPFLNGEEMMGNETVTINSPTSTETFNLRLPTNGTCFVILTGNSAAGTDREIFTYPTMMNEDFGTSFGDDSIPETKQIVKIDKLVTIRDCLFKAVLYVWPV